MMIVLLFYQLSDYIRMDLGLTGRTAFVAGASSGLGLAVATALAREGCRVAICSRNKARVEAAKAVIVERAEVIADSYLRKKGFDPATAVIVERAEVIADSLLALVCDVTEEEQVREALDCTVGHFGGLNVLITNAGGPPTGLIDDFDAAAWRSGLELNLISTINMCRHALPHLRMAAKRDNHARILMLTSIAAKQPIGTLYLSNTSRAGVQGFAKTLSEEVGPEGITVNTLMPGFTRTDRLQHLVEALMVRDGKTAEEVEVGWADSAALKRLGQPEEFAAVATFLASKPAAFITGVALPIDGGYSKHVL